MTCNDCYHLKRIHPIERIGEEVKAICVYHDNFVGEGWKACEDFKAFIGWAYR